MMKKLICMLLAVLCCLSLCACGAVSEKAAQEETTDAEPAEELTGDWRKDTVFSAVGTIQQDGEAVTVLCVMDDEGLSMYGNGTEQTLIGRLEIGEPYEGAYDALTGYDFSDLNNDGSSDPTLDFTFDDGDTAHLTWIWTDGEYVLRPALSIMKGEANSAG